MKSRLTKLGSIIFLVTFLFAGGASSETFKLGILHGDVEIFDYEISVVRLALEQADGEHSLEIVPLPGVTQERILRLLEVGNLINVFFTGYSRAREDRFLQMDVPLTRGLLGHRVFIRRTDGPSLQQIHDLAGLQRYRIGSGIGWPDTAIFEAAGFTVAKATYENLWPMLNRGRFDLFNRGINEAATEIEQQKKNGFNFTVDENVVVSYPFDYFIYLGKKSEHLHKILAQGLKRAFENGSFEKNFNAHPAIQTALTQFPLKKMQLLEISNPFISDRIRQIPYEYWYHLKGKSDLILSD